MVLSNGSLLVSRGFTHRELFCFFQPSRENIAQIFFYKIVISYDVSHPPLVLGSQKILLYFPCARNVQCLNFEFSFSFTRGRYIRARKKHNYGTLQPVSELINSLNFYQLC